MENLPRSGLAAPGEVCFSFLERGGEFESSRLLKTAKTAVFASLVRYFYFTLPNFSILSQLFLFLSKPCSLCTKIPHQSAGFLLASRLSTKLGAGGGTRTHTVSPPADFESATSTNSITPAVDILIILDSFPKFNSEFYRMSEIVKQLLFCYRYMAV